MYNTAISMKKLKVGIVGATGYTGEELVRILCRHPRAELVYVSGKEDRDIKIQEIFPYLTGRVDLDCKAFRFEEAAQKTDLVFLSLPHTVSMTVAPLFLKAKKKDMKKKSRGRPNPAMKFVKSDRKIAQRSRPRLRIRWRS